jgi:hypothetical protein
VEKPTHRQGIIGYFFIVRFVSISNRQDIALERRCRAIST